MAVRFDLGGNPLMSFLGPHWTTIGATAAANTGTTLNAAYVAGVSGGAVGYRIMAKVASSIKKVYLFMDTKTGTAANLRMQGAVYSEKPSGTSPQAWPSTTVRQAAVSGTFAASAADRHWIEFDLSANSYTPAIGEILWFVGTNNAVAPGTDYPRIITTTGYQSAAVTSADLAMFTSTAGFSASGSGGGLLRPVIIVEYADGTIDGNPITVLNSTFYSSNTRERGIVIDTLDSPVVVNGFYFTANANYSGINVYGPGSTSGTAAPGGTTLQSYTLGSAPINDRTSGIRLVTPFTLSANSKYRVTLTFSGSAQAPTVGQIEGSTDFADCLLAGAFGNSIGYSTIDNGSGGWTDDKSAWGGITLQVHSHPANGLFRAPAMTGGFN